MTEDYDWELALQFDKDHLWHPYTSMVNPLATYPVESADGVKIRLVDGKELIDGMSSWWSTIHGYNHPVLNTAMTEQMQRVSHVMFGGLTHQPAIDLGRRLVNLSPDSLTRVFIADSGSVSVEVALKMATQYWFALSKPSKNKFLTLKGAYHGDTTGCMSVCDPEGGMHEMFTGILPEQIFAPRPECKFNDDLEESHIYKFIELLEQNHENIAAVILEPIVQGAGGMYFYSPQYLARVRALCDEFDVLLILDEIATGFGRTGKMFACEHAGIEPDIMCVGKALTGGYLSLAACLATDKVALTVSGDGSGLMMHGPTFMANPVSCALACASLDLLIKNDCLSSVKEIETQLGLELARCKDIEHVDDVRVLGAIGVVELKQAVDMNKIQQAFVDRGVWFRPFGKLVYMMPPYIISEVELKQLCDVLFDVVSSPELIF